MSALRKPLSRRSPRSKWPGVSKHRPTTFGGLIRSSLMARIRGKGNSSTELAMIPLLRRAALAGWRRHHPVAGRPDFAWPERRLALFLDGCFWHGHGACRKNKTPASNADVWREKIERNRRRDKRVARSLRRKGWRVLRVWECHIARRPEACVRRVAKALLSRG